MAEATCSSLLPADADDSDDDEPWLRNAFFCHEYLPKIFDNAPAIEDQRAYDFRKIVLDLAAIIVEILAKNESFKQL